MSVHTSRLAVGTSGGAGAFTTVYTCPAGVTAIVKEVRAVGASVTAGRVLIFASSGSVGVAMLDRSLAADVIEVQHPWLVLLPGDQLRVYTAVAGGCRYWLSGTELEGVS